MELDHLFIFTDAGAPEVNHLLASGFTEGQSNIHPGQGTACRRVFFYNAYLEFLWVHSEQEAQSEMVKPLRLWERCRYRETGSSPFGLNTSPSAANRRTNGAAFRVVGLLSTILPASGDQRSGKLYQHGRAFVVLHAIREKAGHISNGTEAAAGAFYRGQRDYRPKSYIMQRKSHIQTASGR